MVLDSREWDARYGWNVLAEHAPEFDDYIAVTTPSAWAVVKDRLPNPPRHVEFQQRMGERYLEPMVRELPDASQVIAFGGGNALDVGKYVAWRLEKPFIMVPTIVSTGAIFQAPIAIRRSDRLEFIFDTVAPEYLLLDFSVIRQAPAHLNCGGMGECICQLGAVGAWRWWDAQGLGGPAFDPAAAGTTETWVRERTTAIQPGPRRCGPAGRGRHHDRLGDQPAAIRPADPRRCAGPRRGPCLHHRVRNGSTGAKSFTHRVSASARWSTRTSTSRTSMS